MELNKKLLEHYCKNTATYRAPDNLLSVTFCKERTEQVLGWFFGLVLCLGFFLFVLFVGSFNYYKKQVESGLIVAL